MRKVKESLRLHNEMGLSRCQIAQSLQTAHSTVGYVIRRAVRAGPKRPRSGRSDSPPLCVVRSAEHPLGQLVVEGR